MAALRLVFVGPPGTGKGTQAQRLQARMGLQQLSSGDLLRSARDHGTEIGALAGKYMDAGELVPDDVITGVVLDAIRRLPTEPGFILDGFPRTLAQAEALETGLASMGCGLDASIEFALADSEIIRRISGRRVCTNCGAPYHIEFVPTRVEGVCDRCGGTVVQRSDDHPEVVATRLAAYRTQTKPITNFYRARGIHREFDANRPVADIEKDVAGLVETLRNDA